MFVRRLFYNSTNGVLLYSYSAECNVEDNSLIMRVEEAVPDQDPTTVGIMEWLERDEEVETKMNGDYDISVDVSATPHTLVFTEKPAQEETDEATIEDYEKALSELGV